MAGQSIGIVGVGAMGMAFLARLRLAGRRVIVYDVVPAARERAAAAHAEVARSLAHLADETRIIDVLVRSEQDVMDCMLGEGGLASTAVPGTLILLHSTVRPQVTVEVARVAATRGVDVMDACICAIPPALRGGHATFLVGGEIDHMDVVRPHLLSVGRQVLYVGPLGSGNAAKLIKNFVTASETFVIEEALRVGEAFGMPYRETLEMMVAADTGGVLDHWSRIFDPAGSGATPLPNELMMGKDISLFAELGTELSVSLPIAQRVVEAGRRVLEAHGTA